MMFSSLWTILVLSALSGCATGGMLSKFSGGDRVLPASANDPAVRCLCVWQAAEGTDPEGRPCRGVAGQVFFFTRNSAVPVPVDGDVKVFVFDDHGTEEQQAQPIAQFDVASTEWVSRLTKTQFGPAYQVFVPYTRPGRNEAHMAVRLKMTPKAGPPVFSDMTTIELTGPKAKPVAAKPDPKTETAAKVAQAFHQQFTGRDQSNMSSPRQTVDARTATTNINTSNRRAAETIALIRQPQISEPSAGGQFQVASHPDELSFDETGATEPKRMKLRSRD